MRKEPPPPPRPRPRELPPSLPRSSPSSPKARRRPAPTAAFPASLVRRAADRDSLARLRPECPRIYSDPRPHSRCSPLAPPRSPRARVRPSQPERRARTRAGATPLLRARGGCGREAREGDLSRGTWREGARPAGDAGRSGYRSSRALVLRPGFACPSCGKPGSGSRAKREGTANEWGRVRVRDSQEAR